MNICPICFKELYTEEHDEWCPNRRPSINFEDLFPGMGNTNHPTPVTGHKTHLGDVSFCACDCHTKGTPQPDCPKCYPNNSNSMTNNNCEHRAIEGQDECLRAIESAKAQERDEVIRQFATGEFIMSDISQKFFDEAKSQPMGASQWKAHGKKYGYWKYFDNESKTQVLKEILKRSETEGTRYIVEDMLNSLK